MAKRGRPPRTGKQEEVDAPIVREAIQALHEGKYRSPRAAAVAVASQLPGGVDANFDRIYKKILSRKNEPEADTEEDDDSIEDGLIQLAVELAGESPEVKVKRLKRIFRIIVENSQVVDTVIRDLAREGIVLPPDLKEHLAKIHFFIVLNEREMPEYERKVRNRKRRNWRKLDPDEDATRA